MLGKRLAALVGVDDVVLVLGLVLLTVGLWPVLERVALAVPGAVLVWLVLPQRVPFVLREQAPPGAGRRR
jgi:hypothetical protein